MHQEVSIPNIMVDITRESYCKAQWDVFQECLDAHILSDQTKGQAMQRTKELGFNVLFVSVFIHYLELDTKKAYFIFYWQEFFIEELRITW